MSTILRRCLAMTLGASLVALVFLLTGFPVLAVVGIVAGIVCAGLHLALVDGDPTGDHLLETARQGAQARSHAHRRV